MNVVVSTQRKQAIARLSTIGLFAGLFLLPAIVGCPGTLSGQFPPVGGGGTGGTPGGTGGTNVVGTGGSGMPGTGGTSTPPCADAVMIIKTTCAGALCHDAANSPWGTFATDTPETGLIGRNSVALMGACAGKPLLDTANPANSVILTRIKGTTCGALMPFSFDPAMPAVVLSQTQIDCITSWVLSKGN